MLLGKSAFGMLPTDTEDQLHKKILRSQSRLEKTLASDGILSAEAISFVRCLLILVPQERLSICGALGHEWIAPRMSLFLKRYKNNIWSNWTQKIPVIERSDLIPEYDTEAWSPSVTREGAEGLLFANRINRAEQRKRRLCAKTICVDDKVSYKSQKCEAQHLEIRVLQDQTGARRKRAKRSIELAPIPRQA